MMLAVALSAGGNDVSPIVIDITLKDQQLNPMFNLFPKTPIDPTHVAAMNAEVRRLLNSFIPNPIPTKLWHYTDATGLKGIIENGTMRSTHLAYVNDASEYLHAAAILLEAIRIEKSAPGSTLRKTVLDELDQFVGVPTPEDIAPVFVTCFSTAENSLNQWRAYGAGEGGYALSFETLRLLNLPHPNGFLTPVIYDKSIQTNVVQTLLRWGLTEYERLCATDVTLGTDQARRALWWNWFILICAASVAPALKNPAFVEEAEWRYIHLAIPGSKMEFLPRALGLRPYIDIDFKVMMKANDTAPLLPITDLWSGPGRLTGVSLLAGRALLEKHNYFGINLHKSEIPFRVG
jgi:hypothetical protein